MRTPGVRMESVLVVPACNRLLPNLASYANPCTCRGSAKSSSLFRLTLSSLDALQSSCARDGLDFGTMGASRFVEGCGSRGGKMTKLLVAAVMVCALMLTLGAPPASADSFTFDLTTGNSAISGF